MATDLMMVSRIAAAADRAGVELQHLASPQDLPAASGIGLVIVDWSEREPGWGEALSAWLEGSDARMVIFGQHTDLEAHKAARAAGLGPMWARSRLMNALESLFESSPES